MALQLAIGVALVSIKAAQEWGYPIRSLAAILTWLDMAPLGTALLHLNGLMGDRGSRLRVGEQVWARVNGLEA